MMMMRMIGSYIDIYLKVIYILALKIHIYLMTTNGNMKGKDEEMCEGQQWRNSEVVDKLILYVRGIMRDLSTAESPIK